MFIAKKPILAINTNKHTVNSPLRTFKGTNINSTDSDGLKKLNECFLNYKKVLHNRTDYTNIGILENLYEYNSSSKKQIPTDFLLKSFNGGNSLEKNLSCKNTDFLNIKFSGNRKNRPNLLKVFKYLVDNKIIFDIS